MAPEELLCDFGVFVLVREILHRNGKFEEVAQRLPSVFEVDLEQLLLGSTLQLNGGNIFRKVLSRSILVARL